MLIMSQDRKRVYNTDNVLEVEVCAYDGAFGIVAYRGYGCFGQYTTEARAKEVLDLIYYRWYSGSNTYEMPEE